MLAYIGLIASVALLIYLALRGVNIILASLICSLLVVLSNQLSIAESFTVFYPLGKLGAFTFAGKFFLLFACGAMFGRVMGESGAASAIALSLSRRLGAQRALWITVLACALLTYGGVVVFVVMFTMYPLGLKLLQEANLPKRLFCAALALGSGTFTLTALPGTPSIHNVIPSLALGTDLYAGAWYGLAGSVIMFTLGMWYLERQRKLAQERGERFEPNARDLQMQQDSRMDSLSWKKALIPMLVVIGLIVSPRLCLTLFGGEVLEGTGLLAQCLQFATQQSVLWPSFSLLLGSIVVLLMFSSVRSRSLSLLGAGAEDSIMPLINTAAVIGFGGVVTSTMGFSQFSKFMLNSSLPPLLSMFFSISLMSGIVGSASGGLQIFMETMAPHFLALGIDAGTLHRLAAMASGGLDSLPHSGAIVAMFTITGLTHKQAYKDVAVITVVIPIIATLGTMALAGIF
ncbi:GntP family permease [Pseudoteredinibacter isoporae]|uniref:H+/gluconate symporter-like permease n=1 Tax=Pseudoteredinibacter isoporae TaxID=570281 RepID=A0A7X0JUC5_9GAMM|nr:GntP family permease [Pseudoteredinibacter isoporae]MBB6521481.1 H+/gluconate symporter-like permease [Pseudoteredinibacter isoporae]NHO87035.1 GntP family permease [Pseudoteredinibacter isoporae]NIB24512.1 GntP family permease [Pseudoteredinibacter isoporae]